MERILAVLDDPMAAGPVLKAAGSLAARLPATLAVLAPLPARDPDFMPSEEVMTSARAAAFAAEIATRRERLRAAFAAWQAHGPAGVTLDALTGETATLLGAAARDADLLVLGAPAAGVSAHALLREALFEAKAAVVLVPRGAAPAIGQHVAIAWEKTHAVAAAIAAAGPILARAEHVTVIIGHEGAGTGPSLPPGLEASLAAAGATLRVVTFDLNGRAIGAALAEEATRLGADLLVMGAYTHPMFLEQLFGGATQTLIGAGTLTLLLHH